VPHSILRYLTLLFKDAILQYDHTFHIHCEARDTQLGAVIFLNGILVAYYSRKLIKSKQNISGRIFLEDCNIQFHHIKDEPNTLTDARSVSPLMRGRTPWRRLRQQHPIQIQNFFLLKFSILHSTDTNISSRGSKILAMKQIQNCQAI
jgi:hypothetical protein